MVSCTTRKFLPLTKSSVLAPPSATDFTNLAQNLLNRMLAHKSLQAKLSALGIQSACFCLADQTGVVLYEFSVGTHAHGTAPLSDEKAARKAAVLTGVVTGRFSSREIRNPLIDLFGGAVRGMQHIISCRLVAVQPHSASESVDIEDMSEIVAIIFGLEIKKRMGIYEMPKELAMGHLSRHMSPVLPLFDPFL